MGKRLYGFRSALSERIIFREGLEEVLEILQPEKVLLYGSADPDLLALLEGQTDFRVYQSPIDLQRSNTTLVGNDEGFNRLF